MTKKTICLNTASIYNKNKYDNGVYNSDGTINIAPTITYGYSFDIPAIEVKSGAKLKVISIYEKGTSINTTTTTTMNNTTSTTAATASGIATTGTITGTNTGIITIPNNIIYTFKIKDISYNNNYYYCNDGNYPTLANLNIGYSNQYFQGHILTLNKQSINFINLFVSNDITDISKGIPAAVNFIITVEIEEE